uniref:Cytohesin 1 interacting protein n=1 Tax=Sus scrofa TaxID=9823 RepID=A0A8W4FH47_PIG
MSLQRLLQQSSNGNFVEYCAGQACSSYSTLTTGSFPMDDNRRLQMLADTVATLPRGRKQSDLFA